MKKFKFDLGNLTSGPIGMVARVRARDAQEAAAKLYDALPYWFEIPGGAIDGPEDVDVTVFFNMGCVSPSEAQEEGGDE